MSKIGVSFRIDVSKIDKSKLFKGAKGNYLDCTSFIEVDEKDQYDNNGMVTQSVTADERKDGVRGAILGNVKVFFNDEAAAAPKAARSGGFDPLDVPF